MLNVQRGEKCAHRRPSNVEPNFPLALSLECAMQSTLWPWPFGRVCVCVCATGQYTHLILLLHRSRKQQIR